MIHISEIIAAGITKAGAQKNINEDSFQCMRKIFPDTLDRSEVQIGKALDHWQIYSVTDGMGGSGVGDIAGRLVQELLINHISNLNTQNPQNFDFAKFSDQYLKAVNAHLKERLARYKDKRVGCSLAFVLVNGSKAYTFSIGTNRIYFIRNNHIYRMTKDHRRKGSKEPALYLGNFSDSSYLTPQNLNQVKLQEGDKILLVSDGFYQNYNDQEILEKVQQSDTFIRSMLFYEKQLEEKNIVDDHTILALQIEKVEELSAPAINFSVINRQTINTNNKNMWDSQSETFDSIGADEYVGDYIEAEKRPAKFLQGLKLFGASYGIGLLLGLLLLLLFKIFIIGF